MLSFLLACAVLVAPFASNASWGYVQAAAAESDGEVDYSTEYVVLLRDLLLARDSISSQRECPTKRSVKSGKRKA